MIVTYDGKIQIFGINHEAPLGNSNDKTELLSLRNEVVVERGAGDIFGHLSEVIAWGPDKSYFIVGGPHQICVWKFDAATHSISLTKTITVNEFEVRNVALADDYIVASSMDKKLLIWEPPLATTTQTKHRHNHKRSQFLHTPYYTACSTSSFAACCPTGTGVPFTTFSDTTAAPSSPVVLV